VIREKNPEVCAYEKFLSFSDILYIIVGTLYSIEKDKRY